MEQHPVTLDGIFGRTITEEDLNMGWAGQIDILMKEHNFTRTSAYRMCAIAQHLCIRRPSEAAEYIGFILRHGLPWTIGSELAKRLEEYYKKEY